jgi:putative endopeptidase
MKCCSPSPIQRHLHRIALALLTLAPCIANSQDTRAAPGDDFFAYANAEWLAATVVPEGRPRFSGRDEINRATQARIAEVISLTAANSALPHARKVADFHAAYLDQPTIDARGMQVLSVQLAGIEAIRDRTALSRWLGEHLAADVDPLDRGIVSSSSLLGLAVQHGIHGETTNVAYLLQGGLGLGDREQYLGDTAELKDARVKYRLQIARWLELAGFEHATERAAAVLALEVEIARSHATDEESSAESNADHRWAREEFPTRAPGMDWTAFFKAARLDQQKMLVAWQPKAIEAAAALAGSQPIGVWQDYLRFHLLEQNADVLPLPPGEDAHASREQRVIEATNHYLPLQVGRLYVEHYFSAADKARVTKIAANVLAAFRRRVEAVSWMTSATRGLALAKLDSMYFGLGYPDQWPDDSGLNIDPHDAFGNLQRIAEWNYRSALDRLNRPADQRQWSADPQFAGGVLNFLQNSYNFSAALLQAPKFDPKASDATNYGAIGAIVGHEMSHFVDTLGAEYTAGGAASHWWTARDSTGFEKAGLPLIEQFSSYRPFPDLAIDGKLTFGENVADLGGLEAALEAYRRAAGESTDRTRRLEQDREFFIAFARAWRVKYTEAGLRKQSTGNDHAPEQFRVATVRNLDAWYEAFDIRPGQRLYLDPGKRVHVW